MPDSGAPKETKEEKKGEEEISAWIEMKREEQRLEKIRQKKLKEAEKKRQMEEEANDKRIKLNTKRT